ncbi:MAG: hypothetical protein Q9198_004501, partial [Flavoplaca austrocitrina]
AHHAHGWSDRPRTYTVLRNIKRLDLFQSFIDLGLNDIAFPYTIEKLPDLINEDDLRRQFLRHQRYILTTASHLEDGQHAHTKNGDDLFHLVRHLGRGAFGSVDLVWSRMSFREYARKQFLRKTLSRADQKILTNFERELANLKRLSHEHLVKVVGSYTDQKSVAFLMEPVADMNLMTFLESFNLNREGWAPSLRSYFGCLANAVGYLHTQRIKHRDLKPANILVKDFRIYIADFGAAQDWSRALNDTTMDSGVPATEHYMAPEVAHRSPRNSAADMWSLGVVFLEMVTVLRGQSVLKMRNFIANHGTRYPCVYSNGPATTQWFEELRLNGQGPVSDNEPLGWIKDLTQLEPQRRPKPWALTSQIRSSVSSIAFIGICCGDEDEVHEYPSPPPSANSEEEVPLQEQLEALGFSEKPCGSFMQPQKQSNLTQWRDNILQDTASPYTMNLWDGGVFDEAHQILDDDAAGAKGFAGARDSFGFDTGESKERTTLEICHGYEIVEDDSDNGKGTEQNGYEITEDSSESEHTVCPSSPQLQAGGFVPLNGEYGPPHSSLPIGSLSPAAVIKELDLIPELPEPFEPVASHAVDTALDAMPATCAVSDVPVSHWLPWYPTTNEPATKITCTRVDRHKADSTVSFEDNPIIPRDSKSATKTERTRVDRHKADRTAWFEDNPLIPRDSKPATKTPRTRVDRHRADCTVSFEDNPTLIDADQPATTKKRRARADRRRADRRKADHTVPVKDNPTLFDNGKALTTENLSKLASATAKTSRAHTDRSRCEDVMTYDTKPKMTAGIYMQKVWQAASTNKTSVLDAKTQKAFMQLRPGIVWQDRMLHSVVHYANQGRAAVVRELLEAGCNPGTRKKPRWKPLIYAIKAGTQRHNKVVKVLLEHGADVNVKHPLNGKTPLHFAIENPSFRGYTNIIRILLEHGADANALDQNKDSPLLQILYGGYKALEKHKRDALACLLQDHIDVDVNVTPLGTLDMPIHLAVRRRDAIAVAILIHRGSRVNDPNSTGLTPLRIAASRWSEKSPEDDMEILKYLLLGGADIYEVTSNSPQTVLEIAARRGCVQAVNLLLSKRMGPQLPQMCQAAAKAATANKSKMSKAAYKSILQVLESATAEIDASRSQAYISSWLGNTVDEPAGALMP